MADDRFDRKWITENSIEICARYEPGVLTLRGLHYQLVSIGMTNSVQHYKRVVAAMIKARREGEVDYDQFSDHDREVIGETPFEYKSLDDSVATANGAIEFWANYHTRNRWENQPIVPEVWIEKKALQGVFQSVCSDYQVALSPCKGYPSLTFLHDASIRFQAVKDAGKRPLILYFGDYDASGEDIPRSIEENLKTDFGVYVEVKRIALLEDQVISLSLPPAPTKETDSRAAAWTGLGQVELDAVKPEMLRRWCKDAILEHFDLDLYQDLKDKIQDEMREYKARVKSYVLGMFDNDDE